jgi:hypothetical protein
MGDINYIGSVVKILEKPVQRVITEKIVRTTFRVQLVQVRHIQIADLVFWGNLARDIVNTYQVNDYIMVEGYLSLPNKINDSFTKRPVKKVQITVLKVFSI